MKLINLKCIIIAGIIAFTAGGITQAGWTKELPDHRISVVFNTDDDSLRLLSTENASTCIFEIQEVGSAVIHPNKNAIMMFGRDGSFIFKTIVASQNGRWHKIRTPVIPLDDNCIGTRYDGTSCAYRLLRGCNIFIIMLPNAVQIFEFADCAWNELCCVEGAKDIRQVNNFPDQKVVQITAKFEKDRKEFTRIFEYDRESKSLYELIDTSKIVNKKSVRN